MNKSGSEDEELSVSLKKKTSKVLQGKHLNPSLINLKEKKSLDKIFTNFLHIQFAPT